MASYSDQIYTQGSSSDSVTDTIMLFFNSGGATSGSYTDRLRVILGADPGDTMADLLLQAGLVVNILIDPSRIGEGGGGEGFGLTDFGTGPFGE